MNSGGSVKNEPNLLIQSSSYIDASESKTQEELSLVVNKRAAKAVFEYFQDVKT